MPTDILSQTVNPLISAISGLVGVALGGWLTHRNQKVERRQRFVREQLSEFYAPMLGYRELLKARGELRVKVHDVAELEWEHLVEGARDIEAKQKLSKERWPEFRRVIEYDNKELVEASIPLYRQMLDLFTSKMHLAEPSTRVHLAALVEFIGSWERFLTGNLPPEVATRIGAREEELKPLYADLTENFGRLQKTLKE